MSCILDTKLRLDQRRSTRGVDAADARRWWSNIVYVAFGFIGGAALLGTSNPIHGMGIALGVMMFFTVATLISDYSAVFLDDTDTAVLGPLPISDRTMYAARVAHVVVYLARVIALNSVGPLVLGSFAYPVLIFIPVFMISAALSAGLCLAVAFGAYLAAMRLFDLERFKDILLYAQIGVMVLLVGGLQLAPYLVDLDAVEAGLAAHPWLYFALPPCHYGGLLAVATGQGSAVAWGLAGVGVVLPLALLGFSLRLSRGFVASLSSLAVTERHARIRPIRRRRLVDRWLGSRTGTAGFDFCSALVRREKPFRMRTYPLIAVSLVIGVAVALRRGGELTNPAMLCAVFYVAATYLPIIVMQSRFSENHQARWVLEVAPLRKPEEFIGGAMLAVLLTFLLPMCVFFGVIVLAIGGVGIVPDLLFAAEGVLVVSMLVVMMLGRRMPFAQAVPKRPQQGSLPTLILMGLVVGAMAGLHAVLRQLGPLFYAGIAAGPVAIVLLLREVRRIQPQEWRIYPN